MIHDESFLAYCGGFFDGEGTITVTRGGSGRGAERRQFIIVVAISNSHLGVLMGFQEAFGGTLPKMLKKKAHHKQCWKWMVRNRMAVAFLRFIEPQMRVKLEEAQVVFELYERIRKFKPVHRTTYRGGMMPLPEGEIAARQALVDRLKACPNRRCNDLSDFKSTTYQVNQLLPSL